MKYGEVMTFLAKQARPTILQPPVVATMMWRLDSYASNLNP